MMAAVTDVDDALLSVSKVVKAGNRVVFDEELSFIESKKTGHWAPLRQEGNLFFLDVWVEVPEMEFLSESTLSGICDH